MGSGSLSLRCLVTGSNGYIGQRLIVSLLDQGHYVICQVRDKRRFKLLDSYKEKYKDKFEILELDFANSFSQNIKATSSIKDIDVAYFLMHSMTASDKDFSSEESEIAGNFVNLINQTNAKQVIYLSGIVNDNTLSKHLRSRLNVEKILRSGKFATTILRAAIIIGTGSASFEIIRDLVEKLPVMITPKWLRTRCQPIAVRDVIFYLTEIALKEKSFNKVFDIGGPDVLTYKEMLLQFAKVRGLWRLIITLPVLTPRLSSYWLYFVTSTTYNLARNLVDSMHNEVICKNFGIDEIVPRQCLTYQEAIEKAFLKIEQNQVMSSWTDSISLGVINKTFMDNIEVPQFGCLKDERNRIILQDLEKVKQNIWKIGGDHGWYYMDWAWKIRGLLDKLVGGVGLRQHRRDPQNIKAGDAIDFWRVLVADEEKIRLVLYAEMKLPGEAWLEFSVHQQGDKHYLRQCATFRPQGLFGRLYWYVLVPAHFFIFRGMLARISNS